MECGTARLLGNETAPGRATAASGAALAIHSSATDMLRMRWAAGRSHDLPVVWTLLLCQVPARDTSAQDPVPPVQGEVGAGRGDPDTARGEVLSPHVSRDSRVPRRQSLSHCAQWRVHAGKREGDSGRI